MSDTSSNKGIHPLMAAAAVAVIVASLVAVAAVTGILPKSGDNKVEPVAASAPATDLTAASTPALVQAPVEPVKPVEQAKPVEQSKPAKEVVKERVVKNTAPQAPSRVTEPAPVRAPAICDNCGVIETVKAIEKPAEQGSGVGAVAGALIGGVIGNQVGGGDGRKLATVAGAVGGGLAGNAIEKRNRTTTSYEVIVKMENGSTRTFTPSAQPAWRAGDRVRIVDGNLVAN
jgi:outer membrane lipoprotein SlyB